MPKYLLQVVLLIGLLYTVTPALSQTGDTVALPDGTEVDVLKFVSDGDKLLFIFPSEHGVTTGLRELASNMQASGVSVWLVDPFTTWLLPPLPSSLSEIPIDAYVSLIQKVMQQPELSGKDIYFLSNDKGSALMLKAVRLWQKKSTKALAGVILISPNLYSQTPTAGNDAELLQIAHSSNIPAFLFIPSKSTLALRVKETVSALQTGGSDVFTRVIKDVRDRYFFREDATVREQKAAEELSGHIGQAMSLFRSFSTQRKTVPLRGNKARQGSSNSGKLVKYTGDMQQEDFTLSDLKGESHKLSQYRGKVVLINFWASWCPPCVHEMPSMTELNKFYADDEFEILAVNLGEDKKDINVFLDLRPVNFTILLDPEKSLPARWKVFAFPTSYILDKKGNIRYSVAGGIDWLDEEVKQSISALIKEE